MSFQSKSNKGVVWSILQQGDVFNELPGEQFSNIQQQFEQLFIRIDAIHQELPLLEKNKRVIQEMTSLIRKQQLSISEVYSAEDIQKQRSNKIQSELDKKQSEFTELMTIKPPEEITFTDASNADSPITNMDQIMQETIKNREAVLNGLPPQDENMVQNWISPNKKVTFETTEKNVPTNEIEQIYEKLTSMDKKLNIILEHINEFKLK